MSNSKPKNDWMVKPFAPKRQRRRLPKTTAGQVFKSAEERGKRLDELAKLEPAEYEDQREAAARALGWRVGFLDEEVHKLREAVAAEAEEAQQREIFPEIEPWPDPVDGATLADDIVAAIGRYCVLPKNAADAITLWIFHAHAHDAATISPILCLSSPEKRCGKTTVLSVIQRFVPRALRADNVSMAVVFRAIDLWKPTLLLDEAETFLRHKDELRGVLDSGHLRGGCVLRCVGDNSTPTPFSTWAPKVISLIGDLPPTLQDRSIVVKMQRKLKSEKVQRLRADEDPFVDIARKAARWSADNLELLREATPRMLKGLDDRASDNWRPLFAIADALGPEWRKRTKTAARALSVQVEEETFPVMLLHDIAEWFEKKSKRDRVSTDRLLEHLHTLEDRPWPEYGRSGKGITPQGVARLLKRFDIKPQLRKFNGEAKRGYLREDFEDAFERYTSE